MSNCLFVYVCISTDKTNHRMTDGDAYTLDSEENLGTNAVDIAIFQVPQL